MRTELAEGTEALRGLLVHEPAGVLRHERIPFVSYPYEWTFSMLKDAALVQLDLLVAALDRDMVLKDSTPYNVQFRGSRPVFVDIGSFERRREGEPWIGYRQFCMLYLYPLLLQSLKDVPFHPWLQGLDRRHPARGDAVAPLVPGPLPPWAVHERLPPRTAREALRRPPAGGQGRGQARGAQEGDPAREHPEDAQAGQPARLEPAGGRLDRLRRAQQLHGLGRAAQGRVRPRRGQLPSLGPRLGHRGEQRPLLAHRGRGGVDRGGRRRRPGADGAPLPRPPRARATRRSSRSR